MVALVVNGSAAALALLLTPFVFIPGLYTIANTVAWPRLVRLVVCLLYVAVTGVLGFIAMSWFVEFVRRS